MPRDEPSLAGKLLLAHDTERARIAKELHSDVGQQIAAVSLLASNLKRRIASPSDEPIPEFALIHMKLSEIARSLQDLSRQLYPAVVEHSGIVMAFESLTKAVQAEFKADGDFDQLAPDEALCLYRVAENALKAITSRTSVKLRAVEDRIELNISGRIDDSFELAVIRERARLAGAAAEIRTGLDGLVRFTLPRAGRTSQ